jgi:hypothetical protein
MYGYGYSLYNRLAFLGGLDPDATAFFSATGITDPTIQGAINSLCVDLKKYGVWDKMKAIYPFVGGTATTHKFNLKDSRDLDAAFRLAFNGGWTHSANGALPNGTNGYANTFLNPATSLSVGSSSFGIYSRTSDLVGNKVYGVSTLTTNFLQHNVSAGNFISGAIANLLSYTASPTTGLILATRTSTTSLKGFRNNVSLGTNTITASSIANAPFYLGARNENNTTQVFFNSYQHAFAFIGDGLTDEDSANLYYSVQKFQTTLGRQVGTPIYSSNATDVNARLFLGATNIQDATITSAVDTLVQGLKTDGVWSKLKAVYPFVGGTATTHKFNLANALDEDSAFRLTFNGGVTHSINGIQGNGTNGYADTFLRPATHLTNNSLSIGLYTRDNFISASSEMGCSDIGFLPIIGLAVKNSVNNAFFDGYDFTNHRINRSNVSSSGFLVGSILNSTSQSLYKNGSLMGAVNTIAQTLTQPSGKITLMARNDNSTPSEFSSKNNCFTFIGNGLTDTEASNLYTRVQAFQTTLNRQV